MKKLIFLFMLAGCGPIAPSIPKSWNCTIPSEYLSRYNSVTIGDTWSEIPVIMGESPMISGNTQTYRHCRDLIFKFENGLLVDKDIE